MSRTENRSFGSLLDDGCRLENVRAQHMPRQTGRTFNVDNALDGNAMTLPSQDSRLVHWRGQQETKGLEGEALFFPIARELRFRIHAVISCTSCNLTQVPKLHAGRTSKIARFGRVAT